jgi:hypothetical protein
LVIGQNPRGAQEWKYATAISPHWMNAVVRVERPSINTSPARRFDQPSDAVDRREVTIDPDAG